MYDFAVIGAGINGTFMAHFLTKAGKRVLLMDRFGIASGGSGAAGAFLAPKVGKGGDLKMIVNEAYRFCIDYYTANFPHLLTQKGLLHLPKDHQDALENFPVFKERSEIPFEPFDNELVELLQDPVLAKEGIYFPDSGLIEPDRLCEALAESADFVCEALTKLDYKEDHYRINEAFSAKEVVLATGAFESALELPYMQLRPIWGERIEVLSSTQTLCNYHQNLSISATKPDGRIVIGATHKQHSFYEPLEAHNAEALLDKAKSLAVLEDTQIVDHRGGVRSGSYDYLPILGRVVDHEKSLDKFPDLQKGAKVNPKEFCYYPNISIINGVGGRGFVLAPYLAKMLTRMLVEGEPVDSRLEQHRLFTRWAKKKGNYTKPLDKKTAKDNG